MTMLGEMRLIWDKLTIDLFNYYEQGSSGRQRPRQTVTLSPSFRTNRFPPFCRYGDPCFRHSLRTWDSQVGKKRSS